MNNTIDQNNKIPRLLYIIAVIISVIILSFVIYKIFKNTTANTSPSNTDNTTLGITSSNEALDLVETKTLNYDLYKNGENNISISYPQIKSATTGTAADRINREIANQASVDFSTTITNLQKTIEITDSTNTDQISDVSLESTIYPNKIYYSSKNKIFSFETISNGYSGGAHGYEQISTSNYNLEIGFKLKLSEILQGNYIPIVKKYVIDQIKNDTKNCDNCSILSETLRGNGGMAYSEPFDISDKEFEFFTLSDSGITFVFNEYELSSYVDTAGGQRVFMPKTALQGLIKKEW